MTADPPRYTEYKDSGVPWLGEVPEFWEVRRLRSAATVSFSGVDRLVVSGETSVKFLGTDTVYSHHEIGAATPLDSASATPGEIVRFKLRKNDLIITKDSVVPTRIAVPAIVTQELPALTICGYHLALVRPMEGLLPRYLWWVFQAPEWAGYFVSEARGTTIIGLSLNATRSVPITVPSSAEQAAIVRFLDHADRRIRRYVAAKQKLIALLNEQKQAIIHRAVTRGIDPDVRVRPSGVEWLGDIPAHWEVVRAKRLFSPRRDLALPDDVQLSSTQAYGVIPQAEFETKVGRRVVKISMHLEQRRHVEKNDFVISMRSFQGGLERAWASGAIRSSYVVLKPAPNVDVGFFSYLFKSRGYIGALQATADFIRDGQDLNFGNFCGVDLPLISLGEQKAVAASISGMTAGIDVAVASTEREIALVREYRTRLIADVVTGKLDVREAAAQLPDEAGPGALDDAEALARGDMPDDDADLDLVIEEVEA